MATAPCGWTRWFHCESSFDLSLVPQGPGLFAVGREVESGKRLDILKVEDSDNLFRSLNQFFSASCPPESQHGEGHVLVKYANVPNAADRQATLAQLRCWLDDQGETSSPAVDEFLGVAATASIPSAA
jgi:hypothetical protein